MKKKFKQLLLISLFLDVPPLMKCPSDQNKWKSLRAKFGEYGGYCSLLCGIIGRIAGIFLKERQMLF